MKRISNKLWSALVITVMSILMMTVMTSTAFAADKVKVSDKAAILTDKEEEKLSKKMGAIIEKYDFDVAIHTTLGIGEYKEIKEYADNYYYTNGYGIGKNKDGLVFVIDMNTRKFWTYTFGYGEKAFTTYGGDIIKKAITPDLKAGNYYEAMDKFLDYADEFLHEAKNNKPYDNNHHYRTSKDKAIAEAIIIIVSFLIGLIAVTIMKKMMNNVRKATQAAEYIRSGSMNITEQRDIFLYRNVTKTKKESSDNSSSGSGSGGSHGGGGFGGSF